MLIQFTFVLIVVVIAAMSIFHDPPNHYYNLWYLIWITAFCACCQNQLKMLILKRSLQAGDIRRLLVGVFVFVTLIELSNAFHMFTNHNFVGMVLSCMIATMFGYVAWKSRSSFSSSNTPPVVT